MELRNESVGYPVFGGYGGGYGCHDGGFGYGGGILGIVALMALFNRNFNNGDFNGAQANLGFIEQGIGNIRADIGETKFDTVSSILQQTTALMGELCNGKLENIEAIMNQTNALQCSLNGIQQQMCCGFNQLGMQTAEVKYDLGTQISAGNYALASKIDCGNNQLNMNILKQGFENQLGNCQQTNVLSRQIADCCCEEKQLIQGTAFATQLRDLENQNCTNMQLAEIKCLIKDTAKDQELARLSRIERKEELANQINRSITATLGSWSAAAQFNGVTYPSPPFPWTATV